MMTYEELHDAYDEGNDRPQFTEPGRPELFDDPDDDDLDPEQIPDSWGEGYGNPHA